MLGNVGALVHEQAAHPGQILCLCGCMVQEPHNVEKLRQSFRHVDLVFGPHALWRFPELLWRVLTRRGRIFDTPDEAGSIAEGLPVRREGTVKAWVSIMYGCNNFCSYCIVPYVRGRERSRRPEDILAEVRELAQAGYRDITLLGQNVNSYGKDLGLPGVDFAWLLEQVNAVPGDFLIRFMTSHPKDASERLFDTMAACEKVAPHLHLPFQAGNDRVLRAMHRGYTREHYLELIRSLRARIPDIVLTSDVIVGFPGETTEEFEDTLKVLEEVELRRPLHLYLLPPEGDPGGGAPRPHLQGGEGRQLPAAGGPPERHLRQKAGRLCGQDHALPGGCPQRGPPAQPQRPHRRGAAGPLLRGRGPAGPVRGPEDHRTPPPGPSSGSWAEG